MAFSPQPAGARARKRVLQWTVLLALIGISVLRLSAAPEPTEEERKAAGKKEQEQEIKKLKDLLESKKSLPSARYNRHATLLAVQYLRDGSKGPKDKLDKDKLAEDMKVFVDREEIVGDAFLGAFVDAVRVGLTVVADGTPANSKHFPEILADSMGVTLATAPNQVAASAPNNNQERAAANTSQGAAGKVNSKEVKLPDGTTATVTSTEDIESPKNKALLNGLAHLNEAPELKNVYDYRLFFHYGVNLVTPYTVKFEVPPGVQAPPASTPAPGTRKPLYLHPTDPKPAFFLEFVYSDIWAWRDPRQWHNCETGVFPRHDAWDIQGRVSFNFVNDDASASGMVGTGNLSAEITVERQLYRRWLAGGGAKSIGLVASAAVTTDKSTFDTHGRGLFGLSYHASIPDPFAVAAEEKRPRQAQLSIRGGRVFLENIVMDDNGFTGYELMPKRDGIADYDFDDMWGLEVELFYPLRKQSFVTFGARIYGPADPNPWSMYIGLTTPIGGLVDTLFPK